MMLSCIIFSDFIKRPIIDDSLSLSPEITYNRFIASAYVIGSSFVSDGLLRRKERKGNCLCYNGLKGGRITLRPAWYAKLGL